MHGAVGQQACMCGHAADISSLQACSGPEARHVVHAMSDGGASR